MTVYIFKVRDDVVLLTYDSVKEAVSIFDEDDVVEAVRVLTQSLTAVENSIVDLLTIKNDLH